MDTQINPTSVPPVTPPTSPASPESQAPESSKPELSARQKFWHWSIFIIAGVAAATVILVAVFQYQDPVFFGFKQNNNRTKISTELPAGYKYTTMAKDQYPEGFPKDIVLTAGKAEFLRGEDTFVATGAHYRVVEVAVSEKPDAVLKLYKDTLPKSGWKLTVTMDQGNIHNLTFVKDQGQLMMTVSPAGDGSQMNLTYITK